ncbi:ESX secretion-associated protein EspG [Nocardia sp. NPDC052566]|uniref:ESX secretion-associated protein EspG n=1 Tax=Nocardia sp. NPDC052566 TaxID=3364330 RepID=UPI0037C55B0B
MNWLFTPDQFALIWARTDGDRIPYPLAVRLSARDTAERAAQLPALHRWCDETLDPDLESALRVLAKPTLRIEVFGHRGLDPSTAPTTGATETAPNPLIAPPARTHAPPPDDDVRPVRILGVVSGNVAVVAAQRPGTTTDRGGDIRLFVGSPKFLPARLVSMLPENTAGSLPRMTAPLARVAEDSRDLVTVPVSGPTVSARIRRLLKQPRDGIGQLVVSVLRGGELRPFGLLCWIDVLGDGRYTVRTGVDVDIAAVTAQSFTAQLTPMITAAEQAVTYAGR